MRLRRQYQLRVPLPLLGLAQSAEGGLLYTTGSPDATLRTIELDLTVQGGVASAPQSRSATLGAVARSSTQHHPNPTNPIMALDGDS